jgi:hypothetical protein
MPDSEEFLDPYLDPETGVLRNLIGARTKESLEDAEGSLSFARLVQLMDRPPKPTGDLTELRAIGVPAFQQPRPQDRADLAAVVAAGICEILTQPAAHTRPGRDRG